MSPTATAPAKTAALLIDVHEVAAMATASPSTIRRLEEKGLMPKRRKLGNLVRWSKAEIEKWVEDGCPSWKGAGIGAAAMKKPDPLKRLRAVTKILAADSVQRQPVTNQSMAAYWALVDEIALSDFQESSKSRAEIATILAGADRTPYQLAEAVEKRAEHMDRWRY